MDDGIVEGDVDGASVGRMVGDAVGDEVVGDPVYLRSNFIHGIRELPVRIAG